MGLVSLESSLIVDYESFIVFTNQMTRGRGVTHQWHQKSQICQSGMTLRKLLNKLNYSHFPFCHELLNEDTIK